jgi:hypothetical protein
MTEESPSPSEGQFLVYQAEDGKLKIDVRFEGETVWLTQGQMAELFPTTQQNVSLHLQNVYSEGELEREATHKESLLVRQEGARSVQRRVDVYNLDGFLTLNERDILTHAGRISHDAAQSKAELEYDRFRALSADRPRAVDTDFEQATKALPKTRPKALAATKPLPKSKK